MWLDTLVIPSDAPHPAVARAYIKWMMTPEAQALLSQKKAYHSNVPNRDAYALMPDAHRRRLKIQTEEEVEQLLAKLSVRSLPVNQRESDWQAVWENFKAKAP